MPSRISVIIVNYNGGSLLCDCVHSVLASTHPVEIIITDNQSADDSMVLLRQAFAGNHKIKIIENADNVGFAKANNIGLQYAIGDHLLFLNPDCIIKPDTLEQMLEAMRQYPSAGMAGCLIRNPDGSEQPGCRRYVPTPWRTFLRMTRLSALSRFNPNFESYNQTGSPVPLEPVYVEAISGAFMLVRRDALHKVGFMDEGYFMHCEDLDWCMRFRQAGLDILFVPHVTIMHVGGVCSASRPISVEFHKHIGMVRFYRKFFRYQYPIALMWLIMAAIAMRFIARAFQKIIENVLWKDKRKQDGYRPFVTQPSAPMNPALKPEASRKIIVTGATSLIGDYLIPKFLEAGFHVHALSRNPPSFSPIAHLEWHKVDISDQAMPGELGAEALIHLAPLSTLGAFLEHLNEKSLNRIIAFSSTSRFTKQDSSHESERLMASRLVKAEDKLAEFCDQTGIRWTVFRPTLVYHLGRDKNITTIAYFIRRLGIFPLVGNGNGLRQPVHAEDLADACLSAFENSNTYGKAYNLSGAETLTYREMVLRLASALERPCRIIHIPLPLLRWLLELLSYSTAYRHLTPEMANRINLDMCFDHLPANQDFGFSPRPFMKSSQVYEHTTTTSLQPTRFQKPA